MSRGRRRRTLRPRSSLPGALEPRGPSRGRDQAFVPPQRTAGANLGWGNSCPGQSSGRGTAVSLRQPPPPACVCPEGGLEQGAPSPHVMPAVPRLGCSEGHPGTLCSTPERKPVATLPGPAFPPRPSGPATSPRPRLGGGTTAQRGKSGRGAVGLRVRPPPSKACGQGGSRLRTGPHRPCLGRAAFPALRPLRLGPSFPNLSSALKLISEAASGSSFKTKLRLSRAEKLRSQKRSSPRPPRNGAHSPSPSLPPPPGILRCRHTASSCLGPSQGPG